MPRTSKLLRVAGTPGAPRTVAAWTAAAVAAIAFACDPDPPHVDPGAPPPTARTAPGPSPAALDVTAVNLVVDWMPGCRPSPAVVTAARRSFAAAGIELDVAIAATPIAGVPRIASPDALESVLADSHTAGAGDRIHVVFARTGAGNEHGTTHASASPDRAGALVYVTTITHEHQDNAAALAAAGIDVDALIARTFVHELGHALGAGHEYPNDGADPTSVMIPNGALGSPASAPEAWTAATLGAGEVGYPTFSASSLRLLRPLRRRRISNAPTSSSTSALPPPGDPGATSQPPTMSGGAA